MTYRAGINSAELAVLLGVPEGLAHFTCDICGAEKSCYTRRGDVAQWMLKRHLPPGWVETSGIPSPGHLCKTCWAKMKVRMAERNAQ